MNKKMQCINDSLCLTEKNYYIDNKQAYVKKEVLNNMIVWGIYNFQGVKMGFAGSKDAAFSLVKQNKLVGISVH